MKMWVRKVIVVAGSCLLALALPSAVGASGLYGRDGYGLCAYARDCPATPTSTSTPPSTTKRPPTSSPSSPVANTPSQTPSQASAPLSPQGQPTVFKKVLGNKIKLPTVLLFIFPWLLFILLGLTLARLSYLAWQEKRLKEALDRQIMEEKALADEKTSFLNLSSHYLRTPVTAISNGVELMASLSKDSASMAGAKILAHEISSNTNNLLQAATTRINSVVVPAAAPQVYQPLGSAQAQAAGFVKVASLPFISAALLGCLIVIGLADVIVNKADIYDVRFVDLLIQLALMLLLGVMLFSSLHSYQRRKLIRQQAQELLNHQRALDVSRDELIRGSLQSLKTPLQKLKAQVQPLAAANPRAAKPTMDGIVRLEALLQKLVILSSLESGNMHSASAPVELSELVSRTAKRYDWVLSRKGLTVENSVKTEPANVDSLLVTYVLDSLISNAIKYSPPQGRISINGSRRGGRLSMEVRDAGPGIPEAKLSELMQPFSRVEDTTANFNTEGAGLSLYLDKLILKYLGGRLSLSAGLTGGTIASFDMPAA